MSLQTEPNKSLMKPTSILFLDLASFFTIITLSTSSIHFFTMFKLTVVAAAALAATSAVSAAQIGTPAAITQCQPVLLNWTGAQGKGKPFKRSVILL